MKIIKAYSYTRFSTGKQAAGSSTDRQNPNQLRIAEFITKHGLEVVEQMTDAGVSGFKGKNFSDTAALGKFLEQIKKGTIEKGSVLMVENLDRFSRTQIADCMDRFSEITKAGVSIGIVAANIVVDREGFNNPQINNMVSNEFHRARAESDRKAQYSKYNIARKLDRAKAGEVVYFGLTAPCWIVGAKDGQWIQDADKAALVKRIFFMYQNGNSANAIARKLNEDKTPSLRSSKVGNWAQGSVRAILSNRNVMGYCKVNDFEQADYYPQIIAAKDFNKVQARLEINSKTRGGSTNDAAGNVFRGLLFCKCGSPMDVQANPSKEGKTNYGYCRKSQAGANTCKDRVKMSLVELAVFSTLQHPAKLTAEQPQVSVELQALEDKLAATEAAIARFADVLADGALADLTQFKAKLKDAATVKAGLVAEIKAEKAKGAQVAELPKAMGALFDLLAPTTANGMQDRQEWSNTFFQFMRDVENRKAIRNLAPNIFERITITATKIQTMTGLKATSLLIGGTKLETVLRFDKTDSTYTLYPV